MYMALTTDYKGHMFFLFANGKAAKVPMESYATKQNRRKLLNAFRDKSPLVYAAHLHEECELAIYTSAGRMLLVNSAQVPAKQTKNLSLIHICAHLGQCTGLFVPRGRRARLAGCGKI